MRRIGTTTVPSLAPTAFADLTTATFGWEFLFENSDNSLSDSAFEVWYSLPGLSGLDKETVPALNPNTSRVLRWTNVFALASVATSKRFNIPSAFTFRKSES